eukprot:g24763.t2
MSFQWAQNASAPGANLAVYSTEKGQGHVNQDRTEALVKQLLRVSMVNNTLEAEILAKVQNGRKRFTLFVQLFDEMVPEASGWSVVFRKAAGSMQMSRGAEIPELHFQMRKRWAEVWPRLSRDVEEVVPAELEPRMEGAKVSESALTCNKGSGVFCPFSKSCVAVCSMCQDFVVSSLTRCRRTLTSLEAVRSPIEADFHDEDLQPRMVGGHLRWAFRAELLQVEAFALCWTSQDSSSKSLVTWIRQRADPEPSLWVETGTSLRGSQLLLVALEQLPKEAPVGKAECRQAMCFTIITLDKFRGLDSF